MKRLLAILTTVTLLMSIMLPLSVSAKTTAEKEIVAGETMTIKVGDLFSRWRTDSYGMDGNVTRNGAAYTAYTGSQNSATGGSVEENYATVTFPEDGLYTFTFVANKKSGTCANIDLLLDGNVIGTIGKDGEEGAGENIADQFSLNETNPTWYGVNGYASPREYKVTTEVSAGTHTVGYGVTPPADGRMILFIGNIDIVGPVEADYPDISATEATLIEAESIVETAYGDGTSTWANLQNKIMFYEGAAASKNFFIGTSGEGTVTWGEPDDSHFKLRTKREFLEDNWYDFSYVVSSTKVGTSVSTVYIVLHPLDGGDDIVVGDNAYPEGGVADGRKVETVTFTNTNGGTNFINSYCGIYKYNKTVYVPAGNYEIEILPTETSDNKYKFYADYIAIAPGEEPKPEYPAISLVKETVIEAEDIVETQYGDGTSTWANLQNKVMLYEGAAASKNFFVGTSGEGAVTWGEPDATHFKLRTKREFLEDNWYDFSYVVSSTKVGTSVSTVDIVLHPLDGGDDIVVGSNAYPEDGIADGRKVESVTFTDASAKFMNDYCGVYKYNKTAYVPAGNYEIEFLPTITVDNKYKFYADYVAISVGEEPKPEYPAISLAKETVIEAESIVETAYGDGTSTWENLQSKVMLYDGNAASGKFYVGTSGEGSLTWGEPDEAHFKLRTKREFMQDNWYDFSYVVSSQKTHGSVSEVRIVLHPLDGGEDIVVGDNAYPEGGVADGRKVESVTFTDASANFMNQYCGVYKYNKTAYVPAGNYEIEFLPTITADNKYKFYADVITIKVGEEPKTDYPDISLVSETRIEAESMLDTKIGTGESAWANTELQNNIMFWAGDDVSSSFFIGTTGEGKYLYGEPDETHFKACTTREFLQDGWYDFEYVVSAMKTGNVSHVSVVLKPVYGGETIVVGSNPHPDNGNIPQNMVVTPVTITNNSANFLNTHMGAFRYNTTVFVPAGDYVIEFVPGIVEIDAKYKFYADYIAIQLGEEPVVPEEQDTASVNTSNQTITVVANYKEATSGEFIAVAYKGGQMVGITSFNEIDRVLFEAIVPYECEGTPDTVKVFVLEDFMNIKPAAPAKTIAVK